MAWTGTISGGTCAWWLQRIVLCLSVSAFCGCAGLNFERQSCVISVPPTGNQARVLFVYEGLSVDGTSDSQFQKAREELKDCFADRQRFYLGAPIIGARMVLPKEGEITEDQRKSVAFLNKHVSIDESAFYVSANGKLCGYQMLTIRDVRKFFDQINAVISEAILDEDARSAPRNDQKKPQQENRGPKRVFVKAARDGHKWFTFEPGRISLALPGSPELYKKEKGEFLLALLIGSADIEQLRDFLPSQAAVRPGAQKSPRPTLTPERLKKLLLHIDELASYLTETPLSVEQRHDHLTIALGYGHGEPIRFAFPAHQSKPSREAELLTFAHTLGVELKSPMTVDKLKADFGKPNPIKNGD